MDCYCLLYVFAFLHFLKLTTLLVLLQEQAVMLLRNIKHVYVVCLFKQFYLQTKFLRFLRLRCDQISTFNTSHKVITFKTYNDVYVLLYTSHFI